MEATDFDFLTTPAPDEPELAPTPRYHGPNLNQTPAKKLTPRKLAQKVLDVFTELGDSVWLLQQAKADPRMFVELLKRILPKNIQMDSLDGLHILLTDQFGNKVEIGTNAEGEGDSTKPTQYSNKLLQLQDAQDEQNRTRVDLGDGVIVDIGGGPDASN